MRNACAMLARATAPKACPLRLLTAQGLITERSPKEGWGSASEGEETDKQDYALNMHSHTVQMFTHLPLQSAPPLHSNPALHSRN